MATCWSIHFDRGTVRVTASAESAPRTDLPHVVWDERTACLRAPAYRYPEVRAALEVRGLLKFDAVERRSPGVGRWVVPSLRDYQQQALTCYATGGRRGTIVLPTGSGKTRVAIAAMAQARVPSLVLVPTRALLTQWSEEIRRWYAGPVGIVGDGLVQPLPVTVMTFESAFRRLDELGDRFGMLVVDEVHHFGGGARAEALEMCTAPYRLGLTATAPEPDSVAREVIAEIVGPIVFELDFGSLVGKHLAELEHQLVRVELTPDERAEYERSIRPFQQLSSAFRRTHRAGPGAAWGFEQLARQLRSTPEGRSALAGFHRADRLASFPTAKQCVVGQLLDKHRDERSLVFTSTAQAARAVSRAWLIPAITADTRHPEREEVLARFRDGRVRAVVSARVLNEGLDVPEASIGIIVAGTLGKREQVQRTGRVLRPAPGKRAVLYELVTNQTLDDRRSKRRRTTHAAA